VRAFGADEVNVRAQVIRVLPLHDLSTELHSDSWKFSGELGSFSTWDRKVEEQIRIEGILFAQHPPDALLHGDSGRCRSVFRGMPITGSGMMAITRSEMIPIS
jgi:hypothetical protein